MQKTSGLAAGRRLALATAALLAGLCCRPAAAQSDVFLDILDHSGPDSSLHVQAVGETARGTLSASNDTRFGGRRSWLVSGLASLEEGRLGAYTQEDMLGPKQVSGGVRSIVAISDTLTFEGPAPGLVAVEMTLHGAFTSLNGPSIMYALAELVFNQDIFHHTAVSASFDGSFGAPVLPV